MFAVWRVGFVNNDALVGAVAFALVTFVVSVVAAKRFSTK